MPPTIGDKYSGVTPPVVGSPTQLVAREIMPPVPSTLVTQYPPTVPRTVSLPYKDILAGDNPNSVDPPKAGEDPANMMETPLKRQDDITNRPRLLEPQESLVRQSPQPNEDTPPKGGNVTW